MRARAWSHVRTTLHNSAIEISACLEHLKASQHDRQRKEQAPTLSASLPPFILSCFWSLRPCAFLRCFSTGLIYEEVLHYHPDQAARFRAAASPGSPAAADATAAATAAADAAGAATATECPAAQPEEHAFSGGKRAAGAMIDLQAPDQKRKRLAVEGGGGHTMPTTTAAALEQRSRGGDVEGVRGVDGGSGGTKRSREDRDVGVDTPAGSASDAAVVDGASAEAEDVAVAGHKRARG